MLEYYFSASSNIGIIPKKWWLYRTSIFWYKKLKDQTFYLCRSRSNIDNILGRKKIKIIPNIAHFYQKFFHSKTVILHVPTIFFLITVLSVPIRLIICQICPLCQNLYKVHAQIQNRKMRVVRKWVGGGNFKRNMKMVGWQFLLKFSLYYSPLLLLHF